MHALDSAKLKVRRAKKHLNALETSINRFFDGKPYALREHDVEGFTHYTVQQQQSLPKSWALIIGDFATNLRGALDHLAFQLNAISPQPVSKSQFPICNTQKEYLGQVDSFLPKDPAIRQIVESLQPYYKVKRPELKLLAVLRDLSNTDKHRMIVPTFADTDLWLIPPANSITLSDGYPLRLSRGQQYSVILTDRVRATLPGQLNPSLGVRIGFQLEKRGSSTISEIPFTMLGEMHQFVRDEVIPLFRGFFP